MLQELSVLKDQNTSVYMILWELICHFQIGIDMTGSNGVFVWYKKWVEYFFTNLDRQGPVTINGAPSIGELKMKVLLQVLSFLATIIGPVLI